MRSGIRAFVAMILVILALISVGMWERLLWVISALYIGNQVRYVKNQRRKHPKAIAIGILIGYLFMMIFLSVCQYSIEVQHSVEVRHPKVHHVPSENLGVILLFEGEFSTYELPVALKRVKEEKSFLSQAILPLHLLQEKIKYEKVESGSHIFQSQKLQGTLKQQMNLEHNLYLAYQKHPPFLEEAAFEAIKLGHSKLLVVPVTLTENEGFKQTTDFVRNLNLKQEGIQVKITYPLWDSDLIAQSFLHQVLNQIQSQRKENVGIILLGEELEKSREGLQYIKQDLLFRQKLKDLMVKEGFHQDRIRFSELNRRHVEGEMEALMAYGVGEVIILQTAYLNNEGNSRLLVERAAKKVEAPYTVKIRHIVGFEGNESLIKELHQRIQLVNLQNW